MKNSIVQHIANKLFLASSEVLEYDLDEREFSLLPKVEASGYCLRDNKLIFSSYEDRDYYVACYYFSETDSACVNADSIIISTAFNIWQKSLYGNGTVAGLFLSLYEAKLDILQLLLVSERNIHEITSLADQFIKHTKTLHTNKLFSFFSTIYKKEDQHSGIYTSLQERLNNSPKKCQEIIKKFHSSILPDTIQLYNIALLSLTKNNYTTAIDILISDIERNDRILSPQSLWILGRIVEKSDNKYRVDKIFEVIHNNISSPITTISNAAVQAAVDAVEKISEIRFIIRELLESNNQGLINSLSRKLPITKQLTFHPDFPYWLFCICKAAVSNDALIVPIFHTLSFLAKDESKHRLIIDSLFIMIRNNSIPDKNERIETFLYEIIKHPDLINKLFTLTLVDENPEAAVFSSSLATYLFVHRSKHMLECDLETINNFTEQDFIFLVRRILGFISNETQLTSLLLSLLKVKKSEKRTYSLVKAVIINETAMDYPSYVRDEIIKRRHEINDKNNKMAKLYDEILNEIDVYISSFSSLPYIKELEPSSLLVHSFQKEKYKVTTRNNDLHQEKSFIFKMASRIILKAGVGSFHYNDFNKEGYSEPSYLHEFSSSYSLPRRYVMDNIGYDISIAQFRSAKKDIA